MDSLTQPDEKRTQMGPFQILVEKERLLRTTYGLF